MYDERDEAAALNNAEWCAAAWRSHGLAVEETEGLWLCPGVTPPLYPNVVTVQRTANPTNQTAFIESLRQSRPNLSLSVKDSFACLDLRAAGLRPVFDAHWVWRDQIAASPVIEGSGWRRIGDERSLGQWERAWGGADDDAQRVFRPELLLDRRAAFLGEFDPDGTIHAGGIAYAAAGVLGITNVFGSRRRLMQGLASLLPPRPIVGYESGDDLTSARKARFQVLGPLMIWATP